MEVRIPFYNILNMFLTGLLFLSGCVIILPETAVTMFDSDIVKILRNSPEIIVVVFVFAISYEVGLVINRVGSVVLAPVLKRARLIPFNGNYVLFNQRRKEYPIMETLSRECALSRTRIVLFLFLFLLSLIVSEWGWAGICISMAVIYYCSCRKHSAKIVELMQKG